MAWKSKIFTLCSFRKKVSQYLLSTLLNARAGTERHFRDDLEGEFHSMDEDAEAQTAVTNQVEFWSFLLFTVFLQAFLQTFSPLISQEGLIFIPNLWLRNGRTQVKEFVWLHSGRAEIPTQAFWALDLLTMTATFPRGQTASLHQNHLVSDSSHHTCPKLKVRDPGCMHQITWGVAENTEGAC